LLGQIPSPPHRLPGREVQAHKGDFGRVLLVGGSRGMAGSIGISASAALRAGSGLVTVAIPDRCLETVAALNPCLMTIPLADDGRGAFDLSAAAELGDVIDRYDVVMLGPGMGTGPGAAKLLELLLDRAIPVVLDADGLNALAKIEDWSQRLGPRWVLTPHPGEWQRLCGVTAGDRDGQEAAARRIANQFGGVIVLKGAHTLVTAGGDDYRNTTGNPGMATGGSGDCLTGVVGSLVGQGCSSWQAATLGVWAHGLAGDLAAGRLGQAGIVATDLVESLPWAIEMATASN
jgi:NAD(P)H-hydrate epimerase